MIDAWCDHPVAARMPFVPTKCLGPCGYGHVVLVRCTQRAHRLGRIEERHVRAVLDYALDIRDDRQTDLAILRFRIDPVDVGSADAGRIAKSHEDQQSLYQ